MDRIKESLIELAMCKEPTSTTRLSLKIEMNLYSPSGVLRDFATQVDVHRQAQLNTATSGRVNV